MSIPRWLPNAISSARILLVPVWAICAEMCRLATIVGQPESAARAWTVAVLVAIGASDVIDGALARRYGLASQFGANLDALADKLTQVGLLLFFTLRGHPAFPTTPAWFLALVLSRDVVIGTGWLILKRYVGAVRVEHRVHGKAASLLFFVLLVALSANAPGTVYVPLVWAIAVVIVFSTIGYFRFGVAQWREARGSR